MDRALVTTIVPVFNRPRLLRDAVASVLAQNYRPIEIIIVDDGSTDETGATADELQSARRDVVLVIHQENRGVGMAREAGRIAARGEFLQYLDSDDRLLPEKFVKQVTLLQQRTDCGVAYGRTRYLDATGAATPCTWKPLLAGEERIFPHFLRNRMWETAAPLYRREVCDAAGPWLPLLVEEDWEYDCRIGALDTRLAYVDAVVCEHRDHPEGRLSRGAALDPDRLPSRAIAHERIYEHARRAGVGDETPEMQHYARELFLLSRQCGAAGLAAESRNLFRLAREASGPNSKRLQFRLYGGAARLIGWSAVGRLACLTDRFR